MSYLIVNVTLAVPGTILGETVLSFLGIGLRPPAVSWGVLQQQAQNIRSVALHPWLMIPGLCVILAVLVFNFSRRRAARLRRPLPRTIGAWAPDD